MLYRAPLVCLAAVFAPLQLPAQQNPAVPAADRAAAPEPAPRSAAESRIARVTCTGNQLSISASNATLGSILAEVRRCSGAKIDLPDAASASRIFDELGPGPAHEVLDELLSATGFNYVIESSETDTNAIASILLLAKTGDASSPSSTVDTRNLSPMRRAYEQMKENARPKPPESIADPAAASTDSQPAAEDKPAETPAAEAADAKASVPGENLAKPADPIPAATEAQAPSPTDSGSRQNPTTERQITNMEQMFQQRQRMMQQPPTAPPQPQ